jgi:antibiotic biosynthesis monooxygenase (ABM) superfamily enzyme
MYSSRSESRKSRQYRKNRFPGSSNWHQRELRSAYPADTWKLDKGTFQRMYPTAIANGWIAGPAPRPSPDHYSAVLKQVFSEKSSLHPSFFFFFLNIAR